MKSFITYLSVAGQDERWGMTLLNAGSNDMTDDKLYPLCKHPEGYQFGWQHGRKLHEYQLIYISRGKGIFESKSAGKVEVCAGSIIVLFPGEWHRYRPVGNAGWKEYWIGFRGHIAEAMVNNHFFDPSNPVVYTGVRPDIIKLYEDIIDQTRSSDLAGYQPLIGGMIVHLLGLVYSLSKQLEVAGTNDDEHKTLVERAMVLIREHMEAKITLEDIANQLQIGYSLFRKIFKRHTGLAPGQYLNQLKINRAKNYLLYSDRLIKEVAYDLNFESEYYFSKFFKEKTGMSPLSYKRAYLHQVVV